MKVDIKRDLETLSQILQDYVNKTSSCSETKSKWHIVPL